MPATADAAEIRVGTPCVINTESAPGDIPITGTGFAPNSPLSIFTDGNAAIVAPSPGFEAPPELTASSNAAGRIRYTATLGRGTGPCGNVPARRFSVLERRDADGVWRIGAGQSADPADISYVFRVRKRGTRVTDLGPES